jgi:diguanylate cyclase (GGDEF)-like protein
MDLNTIRYRLTNDFQLTIITLLGLVALLGIAPFMVFRALNGQWHAFVLDLLIQIVTLSSMLRAWLSGDTHGPSLFLAYFIGAMAVASILIIGADAEYWLYPSIVGCFFLIDRRNAMAIALTSVAILLLTGIVRMPTASSYVVTAIVCALLSYASAYRTAMQREQLETLASHDELTGLYNRRMMMEELERAHQAFAREQSTCGILLLDLDHFKHINDHYGHSIGDQVLIDLARLLERVIRKGDRVFRFGGEEFLVLVLQTNHAGMASLAEKLRAAVEQDIIDPDGKPITTSIGSALLRSDESIDQWFTRADTALYAAKDAGRNQVMTDTNQDA